jgi:predicted transcriptional regulator
MAKTTARTVRLDEQSMKRLKAMAVKLDRSISYLLRKAVEEFLERSK